MNFSDEEVRTRQKHRKPLLDLMHKLASDGVSCKDCVGVCCTFVGNSMMITKQEAKDLWLFLDRNNRWNKSLESLLNRNISTFSLDRPPPGDGRRSFVRRRYTCPFYLNEEGQGFKCTIDPAFKPYGCLGFNAMQPGVKEGEACRSYTEVLEKQEELMLTDDHVKTADDTPKFPIPIALLQLNKPFPA